MEDKQEKQKEDWTSLSLTIAVMAFVFLTYFTFIGFLSTKPESKYIVHWFLTFIERYGAFLTVVPVMIGVAVAKQQLDANRRQHIKTIRRSLKKELDALDYLLSFASSIKNASYPNSIRTFKRYSLGSVPIDVPSDDFLRRAEEYLSPNTINAAKDAQIIAMWAINVADGKTAPENLLDGMSEGKLIEIARMNAETLHYRCTKEMEKLNNNWS